jgi:signal transduction histidine kinase
MRIAARSATFRSVSRIRRVVEIVRRHPFAGDAVLAGVLAALALGDIYTSGDYLTGSRWIYVPAALLMTVPLAWRRRAPLPVVIVVMGALVAQSLALGTVPSPDSELVAWLVAVYSVAAHTEQRIALLGGAIGLVGGLTWIGLDDFLLPVVTFGGAWFAGRLVRQRQRYASALEERAHILERERDADARVAAAEERVRLARELHDIVGHSVSVMVVQAGVERQLLDESLASTREVLASIEHTGKEALAEMRRLVGVLRRQDETVELAPLPGVGQLEPLLGRMREAGLSVRLRVEGAEAPLPPGIDLAAYRIVQEALTNTLKHAGAGRADVLVRYGDDVLELEVVDDGDGAATPNGAGHGLDGMRERAALYGGEVQTGRLDGGGFIVRARIPITAA